MFPPWLLQMHVVDAGGLILWQWTAMDAFMNVTAWLDDYWNTLDKNISSNTNTMNPVNTWIQWTRQHGHRPLFLVCLGSKLTTTKDTTHATTVHAWMQSILSLFLAYTKTGCDTGGSVHEGSLDSCMQWGDYGGFELYLKERMGDVSCIDGVVGKKEDAKDTATSTAAATTTTASTTATTTTIKKDTKDTAIRTNSPNKNTMNKKDKKSRKWVNSSKWTEQEMHSLDYSMDKDKEKETEKETDGVSALNGLEGSPFVDQKVLEVVGRNSGKNKKFDIEEMEDAKSSSASSTLGTLATQWWTTLRQFTQDRALTQEDVQPCLQQLKEHLIGKNVAREVAESLCASVGEGLIGRRVAAFQRMEHVIKEQLEEAVRRILTPRTSTDLLRDIQTTVQSTHRPYTLVFVGVNGVGKSTNLAKITFYLLQNNLRVLLAACDTFRSGAVEQLRTHVRALGVLAGEGRVALFERGYGKDAAQIAREAVAYARAEKFDVVLIDTAGRMQDNEPLMRSLAKLVVMNEPDKILFVGEALVGNEAVDQLTKFNQALRNFSGQQHPRQIDGIILSKFDTIDDKVGAALSMTFITGQPILFVGVGQTYTDLKRLNVAHVTSTLMN